MKTLFILMLCLIVTAPIASSRHGIEFVNSPKFVEESKWTGQITMEEKVTVTQPGMQGTSIRRVQAVFEDALPTLFRDDATTNLSFNDDKGSGSHTYHSEQVFGNRKCITDCQSTGKAELHQVVVDEENNTYAIEVVSPECNGTTCADEGGTSPYGPESISVLVLDEPLGASKNLLSGTRTETGEIPGGLGTFTRTTSWHFVRSVKNNVELIVTPQLYDSWLPEPGKDETSKGAQIKIGLKLYGKNGQPPKIKARTFALRLSNTSREPGITINAPIKPVIDLPDLRFVLQANTTITDEFQTAEIKCINGETGEISIAAYDGGGYTTLTVEAILEDNSRVMGHLIVSGGDTDIPIPKRPPGSNIGTAWLVANQNPGDNDDKETSKGNNNDGDGLSAYEEYRGVIAEGSFKRLDPNKKELAVKINRADISLFSGGIAKFESATDLKVIRFGENEIGVDRRLNKNAKTANIYQQYALFLQQGALVGELEKVLEARLFQSI